MYDHYPLCICACSSVLSNAGCGCALQCAGGIAPASVSRELHRLRGHACQSGDRLAGAGLAHAAVGWGR